MTVQKSLRGLFFAITVLMIAILSGQTSSAAQITCLKKYFREGETCREALIKGTIVAGDSAKFLQFVQKSHPFLERVWLWSSGGSVEEAMKIGRLIRKGLIVTEAPLHLTIGPPRHGSLGNPFMNMMLCSNATDCHCASACFLIWAGGIERRGNWLGLHRPSSSSTSFASLPPDRVAVLYRQLLSDVAKYLTEMEIAPRFVEIMTDTSSRDIRWLTDDEADGLSMAPSMAEWIASSCGGLSKSEKHTMGSLGVKVDVYKNAIPQEKQIYEQLNKRHLDIYSCGMDKIEAARRAIKEIGN